MMNVEMYDGYACGPKRPDSAERIVRELVLCKITEREAVRRIERLRHERA